jgi:hypothetical protein
LRQLFSKTFRPHKVDGLVHDHLAAAALLLKHEQVLIAVAPVASGGRVKGWLGSDEDEESGGGSIGVVPRSCAGIVVRSLWCRGLVFGLGRGPNII